jgi:hypothetical protein
MPLCILASPMASIVTGLMTLCMLVAPVPLDESIVAHHDSRRTHGRCPRQRQTADGNAQGFGSQVHSRTVPVTNMG